MKVGTRIREAFNCDGVAKQDGGLVVAVNDGVNCLIAFDDGRLEPHSIDQVKSVAARGSEAGPLRRRRAAWAR